MAKMNKQEKEKEAEILKSMDKLGITREEAEEMWAFDHDEIECEEVNAIEEKINSKKKETKKGSPLDKVREMKAKKKADVEKQTIINYVFTLLRDLGQAGKIVDPQEMGSTKMSFKGINGGYYSVTITKHKNRPDGYAE